MSITVTELRNNLSKYLALGATEEIAVTKNGKVIARVIGPSEPPAMDVSELFGIIPNDVDEKAILKERAPTL